MAALLALLAALLLLAASVAEASLGGPCEDCGEEPVQRTGVCGEVQSARSLDTGNSKCVTLQIVGPNCMQPYAADPSNNNNNNNPDNNNGGSEPNDDEDNNGPAPVTDAPDEGDTGSDVP
eukprot:TRINITY_DN65800_c5_g2_i1.p2 TRINITY_DN65800_c5_g2~~TRINITY_DN65800_c5_g2_i1.p2  ORF type:complete len:133 (+),score=68.26 TRINITY_DN65800_c5_g2_i1:41-400(+)